MFSPDHTEDHLSSQIGILSWHIILSISLVSFILIKNNSTAKIWRNHIFFGDSLFQKNFHGYSPPGRLYASLMQKKRETNFQMDGPKLNMLRHSLLYLCERELNTFLKLMSRIRDSIFFLLVCFMRFKMLIMHGPIKLPGTYAFCCCPITLPTSGRSR